LGVGDLHVVDNGLEAMRSVRRSSFTHVFLDLCLPRIDGRIDAS
jgi:CheY-like chemotaxis protein